MATPLTKAEREDLLPALESTGWRAVPGRDAIRKIWKFRSFSEAWGFMSRVALAAERASHHPEWSNRYNIVDVTLTTHDTDGLTGLDTDLAQKLDRFAPDTKVITEHGDPVLSLCEARAQSRP